MSINWEDYDEPAKKQKNPLVMAGCLLTAGILFGGLVAFRKGNQGLSQRMMRARVLAQGATVALMVGSSGYYAVAGKEGAPTPAVPSLDKQLQ